MTLTGYYRPKASQKAVIERRFANDRFPDDVTEGGMGVKNNCDISACLTDRADLPAYMIARDAFLHGTGILPASTLLFVAGFSRPEFKIELGVMAASV